MMIIDILKEKKNFSSIECSLADYFLKNPYELEKRSAREIAKNLYVSASAITRFCQKIGYDGYNEFKSAFISEYSYLNSHFQKIDPNKPFEKDNNHTQVAGKISSLYQETINDTHSLIEQHNLETITKLLNETRIIYITSGGNQINLGKLFREKMNWIGKAVIVLSTNEAYESISLPHKDVCYILISYSGETPLLLKVAKKLKKTNIKFIAITSYGQNSLSQLADYTLYVSTRERLTSALGNYCYNISVMYLLDVLYSCLFQNNYEYNLKTKHMVMKEFQDRRHSDNPIIKDE